MRAGRLKPLSLAISVLCAGGAATSAPLAAAEEQAMMEEMVVTGLRGRPRSAVDSPVAVDTFNADQIETVSNADTVDILQTLVPSYNVGRQPISDGSSFIRPAQLRGLDSHHTLVLVNGKRRHRASLVVIGGSGTQGPDVATIPQSAIQSIEVLRDGASSQYGSDAIAGVINFNLKENSEGFDVQVDTGQFYEGDGTMYTVRGNVGLPLGEQGFLSISGEVNDTEFTERAEQYCESWFCVAPNSPRFDPSASYAFYTNGTPDPSAPARVQALQQAFPAGIPNASVAGTVVQPWGQPNADSARFFFNSGYELGNGTELYAFGNYSQSTGDGSFFYRYPGNGTIEDLRLADGSIYSPLEIFPGGFTPRFEGEVTDLSLAGGVRGNITNTTTYDLSARFGSNEIDYTLFNTINPSLGPDTPTRFRPGTLTNEELQLQADFVTEFDVGFAGPLTFAYGVSYLDETYDVGQSGDAASYESGDYAVADPHDLCTDEADFAARTATGATPGAPADEPLDCTDPSDPVYQVVGVGSNGFPGYSPAFSEEYTRDSYAVYGDLSADVTDQLLLQAAVRYEDYSDFGSEVVGKVAGRFYLTDAIALRGSFGTGFRAPTPGQQGTTNVSTRLPNGFPVATGLFPAGGAVAQALGAQELQAETSTSYTLGVTADLAGLTVTIDYYNIEIEDRFRAVSTLDVSTDPTAGAAYDRFLALQGAGVAGANSIGGVNYFQNAYDSETSGFDIVASYPIEWGNGQSTDIQLALNYNENEVLNDPLDVLNPETEFDIENADPNLRWNLTAFHTIGDFSIMARGRFFGESENSDNTTPLSIQEYGSTIFVDLEGRYQFTQNINLAVGGRNVFDEYPDLVDRIASDNDFCCGRIYPSSSIVPWQGGYYYARLTAQF